MKTLQLTVLLLLAPVCFYAQSLTGLWTGTLTNDSNTIRKDQSFEIVLTQYKDKVYGYSRNEFIVNDTLFFIVKRVKGTIEGNVCEVKDDDIISHNFRSKPEKGVRVITTFRMDPADSVWKMQGDWKTTKTKQFFSVSGKADLQQEKDITKSKLFPHLEELQLTKEVSVFNENKLAQEKARQQGVAIVNTAVEKVKKPASEPPVQKSDTKNETGSSTPGIPSEKTVPPITAIISPPMEKIKQPASEPTVQKSVVNNETRSSTPVITPEKTVPATVSASAATKPETVTVVNSATEKPKQPAAEPIVEKSNANSQLRPSNIAVPVEKPVQATASTPNPIRQDKRETSPNNPAANNNPVAAVPVAKNTSPVAVATPQPIKAGAVTDEIVNSSKQTSSITPAGPLQPMAAAKLTERKTAPQQVIQFRSDSLELALYDNGEIDGDTVTVLVNDQIVLPRQGLKASATRKTVYLTGDTATLVLYAENLGKYPPNTGLLIVKDGDETYQVRFSADFQQNAAVIFKRRKQ